jgi:RNA 2',3'-cyclic 3'-phosphodiesterase
LKSPPNPLECLHISLHALGDYPGLPGALVRTAKAAGAAVSVPAFDVVFDRAMSFTRNGKKRPLVLRAGGDIPALLALHEALGSAMKNAGLGRWAAPHFTPHMTLLYDHRIVMEREIETVRWTVRDFVLVHSLLGQSRYIPLARWPLQSAANSPAP